MKSMTKFRKVVHTERGQKGEREKSAREREHENSRETQGVSEWSRTRDTERDERTRALRAKPSKEKTLQLLLNLFTKAYRNILIIIFLNFTLQSKKVVLVQVNIITF